MSFIAEQGDILSYRGGSTEWTYEHAAHQHEFNLGYSRVRRRFRARVTIGVINSDAQVSPAQMLGGHLGDRKHIPHSHMGNPTLPASLVHPI